MDVVVCMICGEFRDCLSRWSHEMHQGWLAYKTSCILFECTLSNHTDFHRVLV
jgi:hypothetical protein